ncbi:MAG: hypothetical protein JWP48_3345, partial [Actinoallomurus sp.]|nr:hypothetical protein [Actinoallomurus sp.]
DIYTGTHTLSRHDALPIYGFFVFKDGFEYVLVLAVACVVLGLLGPGTASLDHLLGLDDVLDGRVGVAIAGGAGLLGAAGLLAACWRPVPGDG